MIPIHEVADLAALNRHGPISFQDKLYELVWERQPKVIVETGTRKGIATTLIYAAMPQGAHLYSCDPIYRAQKDAARAIQKATGMVMANIAWTFYGEPSETALPKIPEHPEWDLFVHDSDHSEKVMSFELAFAWERLRVGGTLVCDDWDTCRHARKHTAFVDFVQRHGLQFDRMGSAAVVTKREPLYGIGSPDCSCGHSWGAHAVSDAHCTLVECDCDRYTAPHDEVRG